MVALLGVVIIVWISNNNKKIELIEEFYYYSRRVAEVEQDYNVVSVEFTATSEKGLDVLLEELNKEITTLKAKRDKTKAALKKRGIVVN